MKKGTLYGVGVGPGDPELMTLKAVRVLRECAVAAVPKSGAGSDVARRIGENRSVGGSAIPIFR